MQFAESEQKHRHEMSINRSAYYKRNQWMELAYRLFALFLAFIVVAGAIGIVGYLIYCDKDVKEFSPIIYALAALAVALITAKVANQWLKGSDDKPEMDAP